MQYKHSKSPGDNKEMVIARRAFLDKGFYSPLIDKLINFYQEFASDNAIMLDAGCGEGFYTHQHKTVSNTVYEIGRAHV